MKKIKCELCGSTDITKKGDVFVCNSCGTKYSKEEAKNLIAESKDMPLPMGIVSAVETKIAGDIKHYNDDPMCVLAQRAKETDNAEDANKYYSMLYEKYPNEWEPYFYSLYYRTLCGTRGDIPKALSNIKSSAKTVIALLNNETGQKATEDLNDLYKSIVKLGLILTNEIVNWQSSHMYDMVYIEMSYSVAIPATYGKYCHEILHNDSVAKMFYDDALAVYNNWTSEKSLGHLWAQGMTLQGLDISEIESEARELGILTINSGKATSKKSSKTSQSSSARQAATAEDSSDKLLKNIILSGITVGITFAGIAASKGVDIGIIIILFLFGCIIGGCVGAKCFTS